MAELDAAQRALLDALCDATVALGSGAKQSFVGVNTFGGASISHAGLPGGELTGFHYPDLDVLAREPLLHVVTRRATSIIFDVSAQGLVEGRTVVRDPASEQPITPPLIGGRRIFISYRRADSRHVVGRIHDQLSATFGSDGVFFDLDGIPIGADFRRHIEQTFQECFAALIVIGPGWINAADDTGARRLDTPNDQVRVEIETALQRGLLVVPVLIDGAVVPSANELPTSILELAQRNGVQIRHDPDFTPTWSASSPACALPET